MGDRLPQTVVFRPRRAPLSHRAGEAGTLQGHRPWHDSSTCRFRRKRISDERLTDRVTAEQLVHQRPATPNAYPERPGAGREHDQREYQPLAESERWRRPSPWRSAGRLYLRRLSPISIHRTRSTVTSATACPRVGPE